MRILHIDSGRDMRGGQFQVLRLAEATRQECHLLAPDQSPLLEMARRRGVQASPLSWFSLRHHARQATLAHAHDARSHAMAAVLGVKPLVVSRRVAFPISRSVASRWKYRRADAFIAVSEFVAGRLIAGGVPAKRIHVVHDGVEIPTGLPAPTAAGDDGLILAPATGDPKKGSALAAEAASLGGFNLRFSDNLERDLPSAALLLYLSWEEGLGSAALLAMAYGVPVVASRVGGLPEIVRDEETGVLTDNRAPAVVEAIRQALRDRPRLSAAAAEWVRDRFTVNHMVDATRAVYQQVLE